jgi:hypothetical protein
LSEELPPDVVAYVEYEGRLFELMKLVAVNGRLIPELRTLADKLGRFSPVNNFVRLDTTVILSTTGNLAGVEVAAIAGQLEPAAAGSWALYGRVLAENTPTNRVVEESIASVFCG